MGVGRAIISTPYLHDKEMLNHRRGLFCKFRSSKSITRRIFELLDNEDLRLTMQKESYKYSRNFTWEAVAEKYSKVFRSLLMN